MKAMSVPVDLLHAGPSILAAFLASLVEFVEALTVVLAVGATLGWRSALGGSGLGILVLVILVVLLGPLLTRIPLGAVRVTIGTLLLLFGMRWLRKAILRSAGIIPLHDEDALYRSQHDALKNPTARPRRWNALALSTAFKITMIEGIEVVFIVIAFGAAGRGLLLPAALGAAAAFCVVAALGAALRRPVSMIPENVLKFAVGVLLCTFGTFWIGEGFGIAWPGGDQSIIGLCLGYLAVALAAVAACARLRTMTQPGLAR
jgi:Ca2+/H+ antiporter, TMEM165/GDT1 family